MRFNFDDSNNAQILPLSHQGWQESPTLGEKRVQTYGLIASGLGALLVSILLQGVLVPKGLWPTLLILAFTMPVHELIHALSTPHWGFSAQTIIGIQKSKGLFMPYVYYEDEQSLWHFLLTGLAPTLFLTILPMLAILLIPMGEPYRAGLGFLSFFNMAISGGDVIICIWLLTWLPPRSYVRQDKWKLYWRTNN